MGPSDVIRHQIIKSHTLPHTDNVTDAAIGLWERMAIQIISIVGEGGFDSLYARSVFLTRPTFPWLAAAALSPQAELRFANLKTSFAGQSPEQARQANSRLLITFTDILASLIGEDLTTTFLRSAWDHDALMRAGKEFEYD